MSGPAVIIGASHAGVQLAASLRQAGWQEGITLLSQEEALPYHRPPLSKAFLSGEKSAREILLRGADFYADQGIAFEQGVTVERIDPHARCLERSGRA